MAKKRYYKSNSGSGMMSEDRSKPSNCPTEVIMREYPSQDYLVQGYQDNIVGIDMNHNGAVRGTRKQLSPKKY